MKRALAAIAIALAVIPASAFAERIVEESPIPTDLETSWKKTEVIECAPTPEKIIVSTMYQRPSKNSPGLTDMFLLRSINGEPLNILGGVYSGSTPLLMWTYVRKGEDWVRYSIQDDLKKIREGERSVLGISEGQYTKCSF